MTTNRGKEKRITSERTGTGLRAKKEVEVKREEPLRLISLILGPHNAKAARLAVSRKPERRPCSF
jgi:hypothetical protein